MWVYLAVLAFGVAYVMWRGASFFPALRQAQFQFAEILQTGDVSKYAPFTNGVIETWQVRMDAFPASPAIALSILLVFVFGTLMYAVVRTRPRGTPLLDGYNSRRRAERAQQAFALVGRHCRLYARTDGGKDATSAGDAVYLPVAIVQKLDRPIARNVSEQLAFLIIHETAHSTTSDNLLWSFGNSLIFILTGIAGTLLAAPIFMGVTAALPNDLVRHLPTALVIAIAALTGAIAAINGVFANLGAAREYFADAKAAAVVGRDALPYVSATESDKRGAIATAWATAMPSPDRRLHALGTTPRGVALAASLIAIWCAIRTLILMVDPWWGDGPLWAFDAACVAASVLLLWQLPPRIEGARDYGLLPMMAALFLALLLPGSFAAMQHVTVSNGVAMFTNGNWFLALTVPPLLAIVAMLVWRNKMTIAAEGLSDIDRLPPRPRMAGGVLLLLAAIPSYVFSYALTGLCMFTAVVTTGEWLTGQFDTGTTFMVNAVSLPVVLALLLLCAKNLSGPSHVSVISEIILLNLLIVIGPYVAMVLMQAAVTQPPGMSGPPANPQIVMQMLAAFPREIVVSSLVVGLPTAVVTACSWWARYRLVKARN